MNFTKEGKKLLQLFREEQKNRGNDGCMCDNCTIDMINALRKSLVVTEEKKLTEAEKKKRNYYHGLVTGAGRYYVDDNGDLCLDRNYKEKKTLEAKAIYLCSDDEDRENFLKKAVTLEEVKEKLEEYFKATDNSILSDQLSDITPEELIQTKKEIFGKGVVP